jgi:hypothetical protein
MLVGADAGASAIGQAPVQRTGGIRLLRQSGQDVVEDAGSLPAGEATGHRAPRSIVLRQIPPGRAGAQAPQDTVQDGAMIMSRSASRGFLGWEQRSQPLPLDIGQISSVQSIRSYTEPNRFCKHALVLILWIRV